MQSIRINIEAVAKLQILITERSILECEIEAMKAENASRANYNEKAYSEDAFFIVCNKLEAVKDKMNILLAIEKKIGG